MLTTVAEGVHDLAVCYHTPGSRRHTWRRQ